MNIEPKVFEILDGKLYFNYSAAFVDMVGNLPNALKKWPEVHQALAN